MQLTKIRITNFRSVHDSTDIDIGSATCLVGKNESGKTAVLQALYRLNPLVATHGDFDATEDYPRRRLAQYEDDLAAERCEPATVTRATFELSADDIQAVAAVYGPDCLNPDNLTVTLRKGYTNKLHLVGPAVNADAALAHLVGTAGLEPPLQESLRVRRGVEETLALLQQADQTDSVRALISRVQPLHDRDLADVICEQVLHKRIPKFLYFDQYYQMKGHDNLQQLKGRVDGDSLQDSDRPLLGLIDLAGLRLDDMLNPRRTERLIARIEAAESQLTAQVLKYWSQNRHLRMSFDIRTAQPEDPPNMRSGTNILGRIRDTKHMVSTPLGVRSQGFVWFFSFLAWYSRLKRQGKKLVLLFDEPGLSLHGRAQGDLLHYFEMELKPHHQLIYTTHSPFMVDPTHFDRVRIVQDLTIDADPEDATESKGTEVTSEVLDATSDSLFPLQGALGYDIHQTLFVGPNSLVVEGVSDLIYIQLLSMILQDNQRDGLNADWTVTPVGGADKVPTFVALLGAQSNLNIAVLIDYQKGDRQRIDNLYKRKLLKKQNVLTYADFLNNNEADVEDMFSTKFYLGLVNGAYGSYIASRDLPETHPRIVRRIENRLASVPLPNGASFSHYVPARYFSVNLASLTEEIPTADLDRFQRAFDVLNELL